MPASWKVMDSKIEQGAVIKVLIDSGKKSAKIFIKLKFLINSGKKPAKIFIKLKKVFCNECASRDRVFEWACRFKKGTSVYDDERPGVPVRMQRSQMKVMLVPFFDVHGIVHHKFVPPHQTVTAKFYLEVLGRLYERELCKCVSWQCTCTFISYGTRIFGGKKYSHVATPTLQHRPCNCNFFLFTKLKSLLKGMRFDNLEEIKANTTRVLKALTSSDFKSGLKAWERRWNKWFTHQGFLKKKNPFYTFFFLTKPENSCFPYKIANDLFILFVYFFFGSKLSNHKKKRVDISILFQIMKFWIFIQFFEIQNL